MKHRAMVSPATNDVARHQTINQGAQMRMNRFSCFFHPRTLELVGAGGKKIITPRCTESPRVDLRSSIQVIDDTFRSFREYCGVEWGRGQKIITRFLGHPHPHSRWGPKNQNNCTGNPDIDNHGALTICLHAGGNPASVKTGLGLRCRGCSVDSLNQKSSS